MLVHKREEIIAIFFYMYLSMYLIVESNNYDTFHKMTLCYNIYVKTFVCETSNLFCNKCVITVLFIKR